jgi:hypothetical protein
MRSEGVAFKVMRTSLHLEILFLLVVALPAHTHASSRSKKAGASLKSVDIGHGYTIQVPPDVNCQPPPDNRFSWALDARLCGFVVEILPYVVGPIHCDYVDAEKTTRCVGANGTKVEGSPPLAQCVVWEGESPAISCESQVPLNGSFVISGNRNVYFGWSVYDHAEDCKTSKNCPDRKTRYSVWYMFAVPDKEHGAIVLFDANFAVQQSSPKVTGFRGIGKTLREIIIPSLTAQGEPSTGKP